jgi:GntR family transcriptional regulator
VADALRKDIRSGRYRPGDPAPERARAGRAVQGQCRHTRAAIVQLRAEGLITSHQGRGVFVAERHQLRRLADDIVRGEGFYTMLAREGLQPATTTTVTRGEADEEVAHWLRVPMGTEVVIRARILRTEGDLPIGLATSYFPTWVVDRAPQLADPNVSGLPKWLRQAFGDTYSSDLIDSRMPTEEERQQLESPPDTPVTIIKGTTHDAEHRTLHFIDKVTMAGRMQYGYRFGVVPES